MTAVLTFTRESLLGSKARKLRLAENLTQHELAEMAGVTVEAIDLFEHNLPLPLDYKRRILRILWAKKAEDAAVSVTRK
jgi:transcriptional regulator with XRE-family HTH domain